MDIIEHFRPWAYHLGVASHRGDALARGLVEGLVANMGRPNAARENRLRAGLERWIHRHSQVRAGL